MRREAVLAWGNERGDRGEGVNEEREGGIGNGTRGIGNAIE